MCVTRTGQTIGLIVLSKHAHSNRFGSKCELVVNRKMVDLEPVHHNTTNQTLKKIKNGAVTNGREGV